MNGLLRIQTGTLFVACLMVGTPTGHSEETEAFVPTAAGLRDLLQTPAGSLSYGTTNSGKLLGGERIGLKGMGWRFLERVRSRKTNYGTAEMVNTLTRLAAHVHGLWPKAPLSLCNISLHEGGKTPWHASHRAGRDVDILFYARDRRGRIRGTRDFIRFNRKGTSGGKRPRYTFDAARNLEVVRWLVEDSDAKVQWIFVADWLKKRLMAEAKEAGLPPGTIKRLKRVMHQPQDSSPHDDHFHVRLYCSTQDRLHGCVNRGPSRSWVDSGDVEHAEKSRALANLLSIPSVDYRKRALSKLLEIRAYQAIPEVVDALSDPSRDVATKALEVLRVFGRKDAVPGILAALKATTEPAWAAKLYSSLKAVASKDILKHAFGLLNAPDDYLHPDVLKDGAAALQRAAISLVIRHGKEEGVPPLITLLTSSDADVREAAHEGLLTLTNQKIGGSIRSGSTKKRQKIVKRWKQFYKKHGEEGWLAWMDRGFEQRGIRFPKGMSSAHGVQVLIKTVGHRNKRLSDNANRVLSHLTRQPIRLRARSAKRHQRFWRRFWKRNKKSVRLKRYKRPWGPKAAKKKKKNTQKQKKRLKKKSKGSRSKK